MSASRRQFLAAGGATVLASACGRGQPKHERVTGDGEASGASAAMVKRTLGKTNVQVSMMGIGGAHLGKKKTSEDTAIRIVHEALDNGVTFFDNAWEYNDGVSEERLGKALAGGKRAQAFLMTKVCTHGRGAKVAMDQLEDSLRRLQTDHLDLWQVHECVYENDPDLHFAAGGVIEALDRAKQQGKVRFVGFTGHKDPRIHRKMLSHEYAFDTCQMPLNVFDGSFRSFEQQVLPTLAQKQIAAIGMKSLGGTGQMVTRGAVTVEEALRYAMSLPVATTVCGVDSLDVLRQNLKIVQHFEKYSDDEMEALRKRVAPMAADGHFELYKTTVHFDAKVGREEHGYPTTEELPILSLPPNSSTKVSLMANGIPLRDFGKTGVKISALGMGGHHLGDAGSPGAAIDLVQAAFDAGIRFFDNCWEYHNGRSEEWLGNALRAMADKRDRMFVMSKVCTHGRDADMAMRMLEESLRRLGTDHLDLWQIHGVGFDNDPELAYKKGGVLEALDKAKQQGKVRFVGFTGHKDPTVHLRMVQMGYPFDSVQMPLNAFDASFRSFEKMVLPELVKRNIAPLGMKPICGHGEPVTKGVVGAEDLLRYAMSLPVAATITGIESRERLDQAVRIATGFTPLDAPAMQKIRDTCAPMAADGRFEMYKVSLKFDNPEARRAHDFPNDTQEKEIKEELELLAPN